MNKELLKKLLYTFSVSGNEEKICDIIKQEAVDFADKITIDNMGNLIILKKGENSEKRLMIAAHMDEIGFIATHIENNGFIRVTNVGGIRPIMSAYREVVFKNKTKGILLIEENTEPKDITNKKLYVDIGAGNKKETEKHIKIGDFCSPAPYFAKLSKSIYAAKAFDDRISCYIALQVLKNQQKPKYDTYFVFTVQEEVGRRGAKAAANAILPHYALALDVTPSSDALSAKASAVKLGGGAAIKIKDSSLLCSPKMTNRLEQLAFQNKIKHQFEVLIAGGTDTAEMQVAGEGTVAGCISIPIRNVHSPVEVIDFNDVVECEKLLAAFIKEGI